MFTTDQLLRFFADEEIRKCPVGYQSTIIHRLDAILDEMEVEKDDSKLSESVHE